MSTTEIRIDVRAKLFRNPNTLWARAQKTRGLIFVTYYLQLKNNSSKQRNARASKKSKRKEGSVDEDEDDE